MVVKNIHLETFLQSKFLFHDQCGHSSSLQTFKLDTCLKKPCEKKLRKSERML